MHKGKLKRKVKQKEVKKKKLNKRSKGKYPALDIKVNLKTRTELIDFDYIDKLNDKEKAWLNKFVEETIHASFSTKKKRNTKSKKKKKTVYDTRRNLNKTKEQIKKIYDSNNARNRCIYTKNKAQGKLDYIEDLKLANDKNNTEDAENRIIDRIDDSLMNEELDNFYDTSTDTDNDRDDTH